MTTLHSCLARALSSAAIIGAIGAIAHCKAESRGACIGAACGGRDGFDYIVVGSGAGGGPLAARLARGGKRVLLVEAGEDVADSAHYRVPAMHALSTEDPEMAWWYFVKHHVDAAVEASDSKITKDGILYPRGSALGGSTAINAMVTVLPSPSDWDDLAAITGDASFRAVQMDRYYERVREWLPVTLPSPSLALGDAKVSGFLRAAAEAFSAPASGESGASGASGALEQTSALANLLGRDLNEALRRGEATGVFRLPLATDGGVRSGPRELLLRTIREGYPLTIRTGTFVTRIVWDDRAAKPTAVGVEVVAQPHVYGASLAPERPTAAPETILSDHGEVILSAGAFNSPQILALSGVGDRAALEKLGIDVALDRPGVGRNLQDRYEAAVVSELDTPLDVVAPCTLASDAVDDDPCYEAWLQGEGVYTTPGFLATVLRRSKQAGALADLQVFAVPSDARGYYPGYSRDAAKSKTRFSWLLLEGHTHNRDGSVELADARPFTPPRIHFRSFDEKHPLDDPDLLALVDGVKFVRDIERRARGILAPTTFSEVWPGPSVDSDEAIARFVRKESWGHHACCTDKMGAADDPTAVVDSQFRVIGANNLRVVDASAFPTIPGTFIALPTYMLAEKAADVILGAGGHR